MSNHPLSEDQWNNDQAGLPEDYSPAERAQDQKWIGKQKAKVQVQHERWQDRDHREYGDNDPSDPFNNIDEEAF